MRESDLRGLMTQPAPGERESEDRNLDLVRRAYRARPQPSVRPRSTLVLAVLLALVVAALLAVTPAGGAIGDFIGDRIGGIDGEEPSQPALTALPDGGEVLVNSIRGPWVVKTDGSRRLLGDYDSASWSPRGLYVVATRGHQLIALTPGGEVRWSLARGQPVSLARWSPSGFRIAYRSGTSLRVVNGDGSGDHLVAESVGGVAPAWRPAARHELAIAGRDGRIRLVDSDRGEVLWRTDRIGVPLQLDWSADGARLLVVGTDTALELDSQGRSRRAVPLDQGAGSTPGRYASFARGGHTYALIRTTGGGGQSEVVVVPEGREPRRVFAGPGRLTDLAWSPDGRWLLVAWRSADQWLFLQPGSNRIVAVSDIARQFDPGTDQLRSFPSVGGWCCPP
jgi:Tol biopolymer transport system component